VSSFIPKYDNFNCLRSVGQKHPKGRFWAWLSTLFILVSVKPQFILIWVALMLDLWVGDFVYSSHGQPKSARGPHFWKIANLRAKIWNFSKDLIDFAPKKGFSEALEGPHLRASRAACGPRAAGWPWLVYSVPFWVILVLKKEDKIHPMSLELLWDSNPRNFKFLNFSTLIQFLTCLQDSCWFSWIAFVEFWVHRVSHAWSCAMCASVAFRTFFI
jgi:hypothetical protein